MKFIFSLLDTTILRLVLTQATHILLVYTHVTLCRLPFLLCVVPFRLFHWPDEQEVLVPPVPWNKADTRHRVENCDGFVNRDIVGRVCDSTTFSVSEPPPVLILYRNIILSDNCHQSLLYTLAPIFVFAALKPSSPPKNYCQVEKKIGERFAPRYTYGRGHSNFVLLIPQELISTWRIASIGYWSESSAM